MYYVDGFPSTNVPGGLEETGGFAGSLEPIDSPSMSSRFGKYLGGSGEKPMSERAQALSISVNRWRGDSHIIDSGAEFNRLSRKVNAPVFVTGRSANNIYKFSGGDSYETWKP